MIYRCQRKGPEGQVCLDRALVGFPFCRWHQITADFSDFAGHKVFLWMYVLLFIVAVYSALVSGWAFLLKLHFVDFVALIFWVALMAVAIGAKMTYSGSYRIFGPQLYAIGLLTLTIILGAGTIAVVLKPALAARVITNIASSDYPFLSSHKAQIVVAPLSCLYVASLFVTGILRVSIPSIVMDLLLGCTVISMVVLSGVPTFEALWSVGIVLFFLEVRYRWTKKLLRF